MGELPSVWMPSDCLSLTHSSLWWPNTGDGRAASDRRGLASADLCAPRRARLQDHCLHLHPRGQCTLRGRREGRSLSEGGSGGGRHCALVGRLPAGRGMAAHAAPVGVAGRCGGRRGRQLVLPRRLLSATCPDHPLTPHARPRCTHCPPCPCRPPSTPPLPSLHRTFTLTARCLTISKSKSGGDTPRICLPPRHHMIPPSFPRTSCPPHHPPLAKATHAPPVPLGALPPPSTPSSSPLRHLHTPASRLGGGTAAAAALSLSPLPRRTTAARPRPSAAE